MTDFSEAGSNFVRDLGEAARNNPLSAWYRQRRPQASPHPATASSLSHLSEAQRRAYVIADNQTALRGGCTRLNLTGPAALPERLLARPGSCHLPLNQTENAVLPQFSRSKTFILIN